jgi:hypothetical protein
VYVDEEGLILVQFQPYHVMSFGMFDRQRMATLKYWINFPQLLLLSQSGLLNTFGDGQKLDRRRYLQNSYIAHIFLKDKNS